MYSSVIIFSIAVTAVQCMCWYVVLMIIVMLIACRGLVLHTGGPLDVKKCAKDYPYCFRPYRTALEMMK